MPAAKERIRQIITENNISSVFDVYSLQDSFKDILLELLEAEMDAALGYQNNQKGISAILYKLPEAKSLPPSLVKNSSPL